MIVIPTLLVVYVCMSALTFLVFLMLGCFNWQTRTFAKFIPYGTFLVFSLFWILYLIAAIMGIIVAALLFIAHVIDNMDRK